MYCIRFRIAVLFHHLEAKKEIRVSSIRITHIPYAYAPERIRSQWLGVTIPLAKMSQIPQSGFVTDPSGEGGYLVLRDAAIEALRKADRHEAVAYWTSYPLDEFIAFHPKVCEIIP
jgi:hypothetical protein